MRVNVHNLFSHFYRFPENLSGRSEKQRERFYQVVKTIQESSGVGGVGAGRASAPPKVLIC